MERDIGSRLTELLGQDVVATSEDATTPWLSDWRGLYRGKAQAVVRPRTVDEVSRCLALCNETGTPVVPRGGNTGLCGGATPDGTGDSVVLSLDRLDAIRAIDMVGNTIVAEAGCILGNLRRAAADVNRLVPLSLGAQDSCQIGGNLATNAGGVNVVRFGMTREMVLGIEAVLPNGEVYDGLRVLRKDNTGYDLKQLFIGSEGTLGVITAASLRLLPRADTSTVIIAGVASPAQALALYALLFEQCGPRLQAFEFFTEACLDLVLRQVDGVQDPFSTRYPAYVLIEMADSTDADSLMALLLSVMEKAMEQELCLDAAVSASVSQLNGMWRLREEIPEAQRVEGAHLKHDISLPIGQLPEFMTVMEARLQALCAGVRPFVFGHFGDGNLHYNLSRPLGAAEDWARHQGHDLTDAVLEEVVRSGGSISAEHGIGQLKRAAFLQYKSPLDLKLMRAVKAVFDPVGIMNPGKLL